MIIIQEDVKKLKEHVIGLRRHLHEIPEPGMFEHETTRFIYDYLKQLNIYVETAVNDTGVIGFLKGEDSTRTVAFRADIDALSVEEQTGVDYCSKKPGFMHACGHDGHTAILLGFAKYLAESKMLPKTNILFIFQPAEEGPGGAEPIVEAGFLKRYAVSCIFGLHIYPEVEEGSIGCRPGAMMAQTGEFDIKIIGKSSHGAMPQKGIDAIVAASSLVSALQTIVSRNITPLDSAVLTVGRMICGERRNIIAGEALLEGTIRAFNEDSYNNIRRRLIKMIESIPSSFDCRAEYEISDMYSVVYNDDKLFKLLETAVGQENVELLQPMMISEDFSYYQKEVPGLFLMLGSRNEASGFVHPLHSNKFNFNEDILLTGIQIFANIAKTLQNLEFPIVYPKYASNS